MTLKRSLLTGVLVFASGSAFAEDAHHPDDGKQAPADVAKPAASAPGGMGMMMHANMEQMHEHMKLMCEQMVQIRAATDVVEHEWLMDRHMKTMEESMSMMMGMMRGARPGE